MKANNIARRYATGLIKSVDNQKEYDTVRLELIEFQSLVDGNAGLKAGMTTLLFSKKQKIEMLFTIHQEAKMAEKTFNFLQAVIEANRLIFLPIIIELMDDLWFQKNDIEKLTVFSVIPLESSAEKKLQAKLETSFGKKVVLEKEIDPTLIAGIKIQKGSVFYDFSIQGNLKKLKEALAEES